MTKLWGQGLCNDSIQENIKKYGVMDYYPYGSEKRMCEIYGENNE